MNSKDLRPLKLSLHGMDERMQKMMGNYLKLPCRGTAIVVDDNEAHAEIVDVDLAPSPSLLEERLAQKPSKPIIALSLNEISASGVIYVKKPIEVPAVLAAFDVTRNALLGKISLEKTSKPVDTYPETVTPPAAKEPKASTPKQKQPKPEHPKKKKPETPVEKQPKAPVQRLSEPSKDISDVITQAVQKAKATNDHTPQLESLKKKIAFDNDTKQQAEKPQNPVKPVLSEQQKATNNEHIPPKTTAKKGEIKPSFDQPEPLEQATVEHTVSTDKISPTEPDKKPQDVLEKPKPASTDEIATPLSASGFVDILWQQKGLIAGLTCLFTLLAGIYIFQLTPLYEARARIFISDSKADNVDVKSSSPEDILDQAVAQQKITEIHSRQLVSRVIKVLQLNTIPEFIAAADTLNTQAPASSLRQERQSAEQFSSITDYFLQNLNASQFKKTPIINIAYKSEDPELAAKIADQLAKDYVAMQQDKKTAMVNQLADWETNKLPAAKNKVKQSQDALELYIEMNKWSQFEQQFAEDMGVNSEIRALEKKLKADLALYEIFLKRFENLKQEANLVEVKLISNAELPVDPSSPNKLRLLLITLLSAVLIATLIAYVLSALNIGREKAVGEPM